MGYFLPQQGLDQAGFADVGASEESELRRAFRGKKFGVGRGGKEFGDDRFHSVTTSLATAKDCQDTGETISRRFTLISAD